MIIYFSIKRGSIHFNSHGLREAKMLDLLTSNDIFIHPTSVTRVHGLLFDLDIMNLKPLGKHPFPAQKLLIFSMVITPNGSNSQFHGDL